MKEERNLILEAYFVVRKRQPTTHYPLRTMSSRFIVLSLFLTMFASLLVLPAAAQDVETEEPVLREVSDDEVNEVAKDLYCPVCENTPLDVCPTKACADWRELIRTKLAAGETKQDVFDYFVLQYGDSALARPPKTGINFVLWLLPFIAVALGLVFFARYMKGLRQDDPETVTSASGVQDVSPEPAPDDYSARVEQELKGK
ncbi:MAG: cytochrome c-type biogenesis protein CcmH [Anaerolineae bacterium]|nr:cytochrome c-type biogenesis protein CcmH [Anaerolineae bacterium]